MQFNQKINTIIEKFYQTDYFQQLDNRVAKNSKVYIAWFLEELLHKVIEHDKTAVDQWETEALVETYKRSKVLFDWLALETDKEKEFVEYEILEIPESTNCLSAFFSYLDSVEKLPDAESFIAFLAEENEKYATNEGNYRRDIFAMNRILTEAIKEGVDIDDSKEIEKFAKKFAKKMETINKYEKLQEKYGSVSKALDTLTEKEQDIVIQDMEKNASFNPDNVDIELGFTLYEQFVEKEGENGIFEEQNIRNYLTTLNEKEQESFLAVMMMKVAGPNELSKYHTNHKPYIAPPKVGRNDLCSCGSGKKYKKCCGK